MTIKSVDRLISPVLFLAGLVAYTSTLAPSVLDGDAALFQYTPHVLGVTYPTGYPVYLLLAKLWLTLFPFGSIAWRMNLFSALCAGLALPIYYHLARRVWDNRLAGLTSVAIFATLPTFWLWATKTKIYTLNILLYLLVLWFVWPDNQTETTQSNLAAWLIKHRYKLGALALGLQVGVHSTTVLLIPGILWLLWLGLRPGEEQRRQKAEGSGEWGVESGWVGRWREMGRVLVVHSPYFLLPALFYFYIPLRAEWLLAQYGRPGAIGRGLLADFYHSGLAGWVRYFSAADFTGGVVTNWGNLPADLVAVYLPFLRDDFTLPGIIIGLVGGLTMLWQRRAYFGPSLLLYLLPIPFVLTYGQGEQRAFLLTSYLIFALFAGGLIVLISRLSS